jgi:hypothetical protein
MDEILEEVKWLHIRRTFKLTGVMIDPNRITVIQAQEVSKNKNGYAVLVDKKLGYTIYP